jgi:hypothetical protein
MELFSFEFENGRIRNIDSIDAARVATAERVASFVEDRLGIDLESVDEAFLSGNIIGGGATDSPGFIFEMDGMEWDIRDLRGNLEIIRSDADILQNEVLPLDTNGNGSVDPLDVLTVINYINSSPTMVVPNRVSSDTRESSVDVTGDNVVSPTDALVIINQLNSGSEGTMPLIAEDDYFERTLPATATEFPASEIDVLANDFGEGLRLVDVQPGTVGTVEIIEASDGSGKTVVRYTPGDQFRNIDAFLYTVEDSAGNRASAVARVGYNLEATGDTSFKVTAAEQVAGEAPGAPVVFQDADGNPLIALEYGGDPNENVGVLINVQPNEAPYGVAIAGTFSSDTSLENRFFPQLNGAAWITGTLTEVNEILAGLRFTPAPGFSAPEGAAVNIFAFLYNSLGVSTQFSSDMITMQVPKLAAAPIIGNDFFEIDRPTEPVRLKVLANDSSPSGSNLRLVGVALYPDSDSTSISTPFGSVIEVDSETNEIVFMPGFGSYEQFVYIVSDSEGRLSQGKIAVSILN